MMVHVDESFSFHTSRNSYVNFDLISFLGLTLPTETISVKASRPLVLKSIGNYNCPNAQKVFLVNTYIHNYLKMKCHGVCFSIEEKALEKIVS